MINHIERPVAPARVMEHTSRTHARTVRPRAKSTHVSAAEIFPTGDFDFARRRRRRSRRARRWTPNATRAVLARVGERCASRARGGWRAG